jgi:hypothetical protein
MTALLPALNAPKLDQATTTAIEKYVRSVADQIKNGMPVNLGLLGLVAGDSSANGTQNTAIWTATQASLNALKTSAEGHNDFISPILIPWTPGGIYWFADSGNGIAIDITSATILESCNGGYVARTAPLLKFPAGVVGIGIQGDQTSGLNTKDGALHSGAYGTIIRNLSLQGKFTTTEAEAHGIMARATCTIEQVAAYGFEGSGFHLSANSAAGSGANPPYGNVNTSFISRCTANSCRDALFLDGQDANAISVYHFNGRKCRRWGIFASESINAAFFGGQFDGNGVQAANDGVNIGAACVTYGGNTYGVISGQETGASTNAPSGTTADNSWWYYIMAGAMNGNIPAWTSGILCRAGGVVHTDDTGATNEFYSVYCESNQGKAQCVQGTTIVGGNLAGWVYQSSAVGLGTTVEKSTTDGQKQIAPAVVVPSGSTTINLGASQGNSANRIVGGKHASFGTKDYSLYLHTSSLNVRFGYNVSSTDIGWVVTGQNTSDQFGTGAAQKNVFYAPWIAIPDNGQTIANARRIMSGGVAPATGAHAAGELTFNNAPTIGGVAFWHCGTAGTSGTWLANYVYARADPTTGIGYVTGAGGTVTQATSRTTGVTLNKVCGAITLVSAAGTATWQAFTVTNSAVAATDTIRVVQKSGTDKYMIHVTAVAAGSFEISYATTGGTTTEQPVFNFTVVKAVTS